MNGRTSSGIAAIWRNGEVNDRSLIPTAKQAELKLLGDVTITAAAAGLLASHNFPEPEWHGPHESYLHQDCIAWRLGELAQHYDGLVALVLRDATEAEFGDIGIGLQAAKQVADEAGRQLLGVTGPADRALWELSRSVCMGRLYIPCGQKDALDGAGMQRLLVNLPEVLAVPIQAQPGVAALPAAA